MSAVNVWWKTPEIEFRYHWKHIPTNRSGIRSQKFASVYEFRSTLAKWNRLDPTNWKYWEAA